MFSSARTDSSKAIPAGVNSPQEPNPEKGKLERQRSLGTQSSSRILRESKRRSLGEGLRDFFSIVKTENSDLLETKWTTPYEFANLKKSLQRAKRHTLRRQSGISPHEDLYKKILADVQDHIYSHPLEVITFIQRFSKWDKPYKYLDTHKDYAVQLQEVFENSLRFLSDSFKEYEAKLIGKLNADCIIEAFKYNEKLATIKQLLVLHFQRKLKEKGFSREMIDSVDRWPAHIKGLKRTIREFKAHVREKFPGDSKNTLEETELKQIINLSKQECFKGEEDYPKEVLATAKMIRKLNRLSSNISNYVQFFILEKPQTAWRRIQTVIFVAQHAINTQNFFFGKSIHTALMDGLYVCESSLPYVWETFYKKKSAKNARDLLSKLCKLLNINDNHKKLIDHMLSLSKNDSELFLVPHTPYLLTRLFLLGDKIQTNHSDYCFEKFKCKCMKLALNKPAKLKILIENTREKSPERKYAQSIQEELNVLQESDKSELFQKWKEEIETIQKALRKMKGSKDDQLEQLYSEIKSFIEQCISKSKKRENHSQLVASDFIKTVLHWHKKEPSEDAYSILKKKANSFGEKKLQKKTKKTSPRTKTEVSTRLSNEPSEDAYSTLKKKAKKKKGKQTSRPVSEVPQSSSPPNVVQNPLLRFSEKKRTACPKMVIPGKPSTEDVERFLENPYIQFFRQEQTIPSTPAQLGNGNDSIG